MPFINVTIAAGRTIEQKQHLMRALTDAAHQAVGAPLDTIRVWINEIPAESMAVGGVPFDQVSAARQAAAEGTPTS
jgi:4-oxalocrotonate tautomerase